MSGDSIQFAIQFATAMASLKEAAMSGEALELTPAQTKAMYHGVAALAQGKRDDRTTTEKPDDRSER